MSDLAIHGGPKAVRSPADDMFRWPIITEEDERAALEVLRAGSMSGTDVTVQFEREFARRQASPEIQGLRDELAASGLRERDPAAYRHRSFELSVAGYFADPRAARDLTPFRVTGRVQQSVWDSLGDYDLVADPELRAITTPTLIVHGRVAGNVTASERVELKSSARVTGDIDAPVIVMEAGAVHDGQCQMTKEKAAEPSLSLVIPFKG